MQGNFGYHCAHNTAQNTADNLLAYPSDSHNFVSKMICHLLSGSLPSSLLRCSRCCLLSPVYGRQRQKWNKSSPVAEMGDRLTTIYMGRTVGAAVPSFFCRGAEYLSHTMSPGPRPTSVPSGILIHPAVWPQQTWAKNWGGAVPLLGSHLTQCGMGRGLLPYQMAS